MRLAILLVLKKRLIGKSGIINSGVYLFKKDVINFCKYKDNFSLEKDLFPNLVKIGLTAYCSKSKLIDIGTEKSLKDAQKILNYTSQKNEKDFLTMIIPKRNDDYKGNFKNRLTNSINYISKNIHELGYNNLMEILTVDWNSKIPIQEELNRLMKSLK